MNFPERFELQNQNINDASLKINVISMLKITIKIEIIEESKFSKVKSRILGSGSF